jgi:hypothetical protein
MVEQAISVDRPCGLARPVWTRLVRSTVEQGGEMRRAWSTADTLLAQLNALRCRSPPRSGAVVPEEVGRAD